jgi:GNAT superfamily N-acetyltransferase
MTAVRVRVPDRDEHSALVDLVLREQPHAERVEIAPLFLDDTIFQERRVVAAYDDALPVGCGLLTHAHAQPEGRWTARVVVAESHRDRGIGRELAEALLSGQDDIAELRTWTYDDDPRSVAIAEHWGFHTLQRSLTSLLDVSRVSAPEAPAGVTLSIHRDVGLPDPAAVDAMVDASQTNPERAHSGPFTLTELIRMVGEDETPILVLARVDGVPAAVSLGTLAGDVTYVMYTGVDPAFRGRGLALLVKQALHADARDLGATRCLTENEEANAGIRRINAELGYQVLFSALRMQRLLRAGG